MLGIGAMDVPQVACVILDVLLIAIAFWQLCFTQHFYGGSVAYTYVCIMLGCSAHYACRYFA